MGTLEQSGKHVDYNEQLRPSGKIGAAMGTALFAALAGGLALPPMAEAGSNPPAASSTTTVVNPNFTKKEALRLFTTFAGVGEAFEGALPKEFTNGLAQFLAPTKWEPIRDVIVNGTLHEITNLKDEKSVKWWQDNYAAIDASGDPNIPTPDGKAVIAAINIQQILLMENPLDLAKRGVHFVKPGVPVAGDQPGRPVNFEKRSQLPTSKPGG